MKKVIAFDHYEKRRLRKIAEACQPGSILDIGYAQQPNPYLPLQITTGVDITLPTKSSGYREEVLADALQIPAIMEGRYFDNIIAAEFIEHLESPYDFLRSIKASLKPEGVLIITTPNPVSWPCIVFEWAMSRRYYFTSDHTYYFPPRWVIRMLENCGYRVTKTAGIGLLLPYITLPSPTSFSYQTMYIARHDR